MAVGIRFGVTLRLGREGAVERDQAECGLHLREPAQADPQVRRPAGRSERAPAELIGFADPAAPYLPLRDRLMRVTMSSQACSSSAG